MENLVDFRPTTNYGQKIKAVNNYSVILCSKNFLEQNLKIMFAWKIKKNLAT